MLALRVNDIRTRQAETQAAADARVQSDAEYEAQWARQSAGHTVSMTDTDFDFVPVRPPLQVAALAPPKSDFAIVAPELDIQNVAIVPRPFLAADSH